MLRKWMSMFLTITLLVTMLGTAFAGGTIYKLGDSGDAVKRMQDRLAELGYTETETDGTFGEGTEKALLRFQQENNLLETGMADEITMTLLLSESAIAATPNSVLWDMITEMVEEDICCYMALPNTCALAYYDTDIAWNTREYTTFAENGFQSVFTSPLSTFAADVDTASWTQIRQMLLQGETVSPDMVRIEEMLNYFHYNYKAPTSGEPFGVTMELGDCPWNAQTKLLLVGLQAEEIPQTDTPKNLVFLIDVSGSMDEEDKLPLVKRSFLLLLDTLQPTDTVSIVTYASADTVVLDGVPAANKTTIMEAINLLEAGGCTNGAAGMLTAYQIAEKHFVQGGINRILLATDGDLNVGITSEGDLARLVMQEKENGVALTCLGFGGDNYKDNRMEALADYGDGNYRYIDSIHEARRALVTEAGGTFNTVAKDVKLQLDFNPSFVKGYRLIGYEDRLLAAEDFANDTVDGGEIGSGHRVTALYEIVPADSDFDFGAVESKYTAIAPANSIEWLTLSIRAKAPDGDTSTLYTYPLIVSEATAPTENWTFAAAVTELGMLLRDSQWKGTATWDSALTLLRSCPSVTGDVYKEELVYLAGLMQRNQEAAQ